MSIQKQVAETSPVIAAESPSAIVSDARAAEIRAALTAEHGAVWMHYYHREIENEVLRILQGNIDSGVRSIDEIEREETLNACRTRDGTLVEAKPHYTCTGCVFDKGADFGGTHCGQTPLCGSVSRTDKRAIIWVNA